jgi:glycosyltransferase involved in cell wall biosynthesis
MSQSTVALMLESEGPGGAEVVVLHLAEELRRRGHGVVPVVLTRATEPGWLEQACAARGFTPERVGIRGAIDTQCLRDLLSLLRRREVTAVHSHEFGMAIYGTVACLLLRLPHVITMHGNMWMTNAFRRRAALRWAFRFSETTAVSDDTRRHLVRALGVPDSRIRTVLNGVPELVGHRTKVRHELGLGDEVVLITAVGNLIERKGHAFLIRALALVAARVPDADWHLAIAGEGVERPQLEALARESGTSHRVHLLGHRHDIADVLAASNVFVMPSTWEGLPLAVLEAMFAGTAVIASGISGIPEAIADGVDGLLVPPGEVEPLAAALQSLITDQARREAMGQSAYARACEQFSVGTMTAQYEALYRTDR